MEMRQNETRTKDTANCRSEDSLICTRRSALQTKLPERVELSVISSYNNTDSTITDTDRKADCDIRVLCERSTISSGVIAPEPSVSRSLDDIQSVNRNVSGDAK